MKTADQHLLYVLITIRSLLKTLISPTNEQVIFPPLSVMKPGRIDGFSALNGPCYLLMDGSRNVFLAFFKSGMNENVEKRPLMNYATDLNEVTQAYLGSWGSKY